jgi:hypothetical protein
MCKQNFDLKHYALKSRIRDNDVSLLYAARTHSDAKNFERLTDIYKQRFGGIVKAMQQSQVD